MKRRVENAMICSIHWQGRGLFHELKIPLSSANSNKM